MKTLKYLPFALLLLMLLVLAVSTVIEKMQGSVTVYGSVAFAALWAAIAIASIALVILGKVSMRLPVLLLHISLLVILVGAAFSRFTAVSGKLHLAVGSAYNTFVDNDNQQHNLPFYIKVDKFEVKYYPGTQAPLDFVSHVTATTPHGGAVQGVVSMNHVFSHAGYRFYQAGYSPDGRATAFTITYDPWGIAVTYLGYALLLVSMVMVLCSSRSRFRLLLRQVWTKRALSAATLLLAAVAAHAQPQSLPERVASKFGDLYILYNNRVCPFNTFDRDFTLKLTGSDHYKGLTADQVATGWLFFYDDWAEEPMIRVKGDRVKAMLKLDASYISLDNLATVQRDESLKKKLDDVLRGSDAVSRRQVLEVTEKVSLANAVGNGDLVLIFPLRYKGELQWYAPSTRQVPPDIDPSQWLFMRKGLDYFYQLVVMHDYDGACRFLDKLRAYQVKEGGDSVPSSLQFDVEIIYNKYLSAHRPLAIVLASLGVLLFACFSRCLVRRRSVPRWVTWSGKIALLLAFLYVSLSIGARWVVSAHVPLSNGFETMQFLCWLLLLLSLVFGHKFSLLLPFGFLAGDLALLVASIGESNPPVTQLMPVLHSSLLSLHVVVIMLSYSLLTFVTLGSLTALMLHTDSQRVHRLQSIGLVLLYPAVFLLAAGIIIGAVWANVAWGSYWTWDPKETWALITLAVYALMLHNRALPAFNRPMFFHCYAVLAFLCVLITYFGVNFLLGGMHSYA